MLYCSRCGVELEADIKKCPLCDTSINVSVNDEGSDTNSSHKLSTTEMIDEYSKDTRYKKVLESITLIILIPFLILMSIDMVTSQNLTWSKIPLISLVYSWMIFFFPLLFRKNIPVILVGEIASIITFIAMIDYVQNYTFNWFLQIAAPILFVLISLVLLLIFLISRVKRVGVNVAGYIIGAAGVFCLFLELIISYNALSEIYASWSLIVFASCSTISCALLYFYHRYDSFEILSRFFDV
jgi:hypothetical protein